jgi:serine/threonine-protein kinase
MTPEQWSRLRSLFAAAVEGSAEERAAVVAAAQAEDHALAGELLRLLAADDDAAEATTATWLRSPLAEPGGADPTQVDRYRILGPLGEGGMGRVFLAERSDGAYRQRVALKVLSAGTFGSADARRRFRAERQILARLSHPAIARLIDGGETPNGEPFLAMELVEGRPIDDYCRERRLAPDEVVALFLTVCTAVDAAHRSLVVHRDLKPSNVLVTADGQPKLLDFGIAKLLADDEGEPATLLTRHGRSPLTPRYAAPEQVRGEPVTVATDVYALGVMLYELLTGVSPYGGESATPASLALAICDHQPRAPSTVPGLLASTGPTLAARRWLAGDLDAIVLKSLRKEPALRYGSAAELAADLRRLLDGEPVMAREGNRLYHWRKFARRHRLALAAAAAVALALAGAALVSLRQARLAAVERDRAVAAEERARLEAAAATQVVEFLTALYEQADPERTQGKVPTVVEVLEQSRTALAAGGPREPRVRAALQTALARAYLATGQAEPAAALARDALAGSRAGDAAAPRLALGRAQALLGDLPAAEATLRTAHREAIAGGEPLAAVRRQAAAALADVLAERNAYDEARTLRLALLAEAAHALGVDPTAPRVPSGPLDERWGELADALYELAALDLDRGDYAAAVTTSERALAVARRVWGEEDSRVLGIMMGLGNALDEVDRPADAAEPLARAVAGYRRVYGPRHVELAKALVNQGGVLRRLDRFAESAAALEEGVAIFTDTLGRVHRYTAVALNNLGNTYISAGDPERGLTTHREALAVRRELWPAGHPEIGQSLRNLGNLYNGLDRPAEGLLYMQQAADAYLAAFGPEHPRSVDAQMAVGATLAALERWEEAREVLTTARRRAVALEDPLLAVRIGEYLARTLEAQGEPAEALVIAREALVTVDGLRLGDREYDRAELAALVARLEAMPAAHPVPPPGG